MTHTSTEQPYMPQATLHPAQEECIRLQARILELEAAQAQRVPLTQKQRKQLVCSYFAEPWAMEKADAMLHELERSECITQEKQG